MPEILNLVIDGRPVGHVEGVSRTERKVFGQFIPGAGLQPYRAEFEAAVALDREFEARASHEPMDYPLWDRLMAAFERITQLKPSLEGVRAEIEDFALWQDWSVEITLVKDSGGQAHSPPN